MCGVWNCGQVMTNGNRTMLNPEKERFSIAVALVGPLQDLAGS